MTQAADTDTNPFALNRFGVPVGGVPFDLVDVVRAYNANFTAADLSVALSDVPDPVKRDKVLTYTATVQNGGSAAANGVVLTDPLPTGVALKSLSTTQGTCTSAKTTVVTVKCALGGMASGSTATVTIAVQHLTAGTMSNTVTVAAQSPADPAPGNNSATASTTVKR